MRVSSSQVRSLIDQDENIETFIFCDDKNKKRNLNNSDSEDDPLPAKHRKQKYRAHWESLQEFKG